MAGSIVCGVAWWGNDILLNLLILEDWLLWFVRIHKPESVVLEVIDDGEFGDEDGRIPVKGTWEI